MKIVIWANHTDLSQNVKKELLRVARDKIQIDQNNPDVVISIGGDGTLLSAFHHYIKLAKQPHFIAVHTGHLGFYTDFLSGQVEELVRYLLGEEHKTYSYPLLSTTLLMGDQEKKLIALNEMTLKTISGTFVCEVEIGQELFEVFRGDGICISTPTGSTGLSKSFGGAVVHPSVEAIQMVEIAAINNIVYRTIGAPLIFPKEETITLNVKASHDILLAIDNCEPIILNADCEPVIQVTLATERIHFLNYKQISFWSRVEKAFIGANKG